MRAYYNANAGLNYIMGMQQFSQVNGTSFSNFASAMGGGSAVAYNMGSGGNFSFQLGNMVANGTNGTYQVTSLVGGEQIPLVEAHMNMLFMEEQKGIVL